MKNIADLKSGDRIRMISMPDDPDPIPPGTLGTVDNVVRCGSAYHINMKSWDNGRSLNPVCPPDLVQVVE